MARSTLRRQRQKRRSSPPIRGAAWAAAAAAATLVSGCGEQSPLKPESEPAREIAKLAWWMFGIAGVVFAGA